MVAGRRSLVVIALVAVLAGCGAGPGPATVPVPSAARPTGTTAPILSAVTPTPSAAGRATAAPSPVGQAAPPSASSAGTTQAAEPTPTALPTPPSERVPPTSPPLASESFVTPAPPNPARAWTGLRWQKIGATNPLAHVRSITRWRGGFVATGDLVVSAASVRTRTWTSTDGRRWVPLDASVFGPRTIVVGVAAMSGGVMAFTMQAGSWSWNEPSTEVGQWSLTGPWQSWTSVDGQAWTAHPGPPFPPPERALTLVPAAGSDLVALVYEAQPIAFTRDGVAWETASLDAFPGGPVGWEAQSIVAFPPGFLDVGYGGGAKSGVYGPRALASSDGFYWRSTSLPAACPPGSWGLVAGRSGVILIGQEGDPHGPTETWCSSLDGRTWRRLPGYSPLGTIPEGACRGTCANGSLLGDGTRLIAYQSAPRQVAWTSFDGRTWRRLALTGALPSDSRDGSYGWEYEKLLLPIGLLFRRWDGSGSVWFGNPRT